MKKRYNYVMQYENIDPKLFKPLSTDLNNGDDRGRFGVFKTVVSPKNTEIAVAVIKAIDVESRLEFPLISITDNTTTGMSLTNNMEDSLNFIAQLLNIDLLGVTIIYRDTELQWDGVRIKAFHVHHDSAIMEITRADFMVLNDRSLTETQAAQIVLDLNRVQNYSAPL